jgi:hypothetical protein
MDSSIPQHLIEEQKAVEASIREAFRGTRRAGGISWSESREVDNYEGPEKRAAASALDKETSWEDLVDDPGWDDEAGVGGFNFLDAIGYAYYLAPAMIRCVRNGEAGALGYAVTVDNEFKRELVRLVDGRRALAVAQFLKFMIAVAEEMPDYRFDERWRYAYEIYWQKFENAASEG